MDNRAVLFVDDEPNFLSAIKRVLVEEPYEIHVAGSAKEALSILEKKDIQVIVADIRMPIMSGIELLEIVREKYPHIIRLVISGQTDIDTVLDTINKGVIFRFIPKPWNHDDELKIIILQAIEYYDLHSDKEMLMEFLEKLSGEKREGQINSELIRTLLMMRERHMYEWSQKCCSVTPVPDDPEQERTG
jgi:DNA-binding NtrC family response regulator